MIRRIQTTNVFLDRLRPFVLANIVDVHHPESAKDDEIASDPWRSGFQTALRQRQQVPRGIESCQLDVEVALRQLQRRLRPNGDVVEAFEEASYIADPFPQDQFPATCLLCQSHCE